MRTLITDSLLTYLTSHSKYYEVLNDYISDVYGYVEILDLALRSSPVSELEYDISNILSIIKDHSEFEDYLVIEFLRDIKYIISYLSSTLEVSDGDIEIKSLYIHNNNLCIELEDTVVYPSLGKITLLKKELTNEISSVYFNRLLTV